MSVSIHIYIYIYIPTTRRKHRFNDVRPISVIRFRTSRVGLNQNLNSKGLNSHVHRGFHVWAKAPRYFRRPQKGHPERAIRGQRPL